MTALPANGLADPIPTQSGWVTLKRNETNPSSGDKLFRRYSVVLDDRSNPFRNLLIYNCSRTHYSHLTVIVPQGYQIKSFPREHWVPRFSAIFLVGKTSFSMPGEYRNGELFFDLTDETHDAFVRVMNASAFSLAFGARNDIIEFEIQPRVDDLYEELFAKGMSDHGPATFYKSSGAVESACREHQVGRK